MTSVSYFIPSINCGGCRRRIEIGLSALQGIQTVKVEVPTKTAAITFEAPLTEDMIKAFLASIHYPVEGNPMNRLVSSDSCGIN